MNKMINEIYYSGGQINSLKSQLFKLPVKYNEQKRNLPCSMVEREKLRDHDLKKLREALSGYYGLICASHFGRMVPAITVQMMPL
ncbi:hypothetical protein [Sphingobacterium paucimobilis]|uniref:Uncharacterized protein n=1 Tax=Sphingobacterium paucimobilis HER1398 TaxID=1346330 RepID=U2J6B0_9SPHI|nr:hypothetical protein [Sphingobacterium paucimobilis]ERJ58188.1 hypothetical protein M472_05365 [Sphingobacterium paucimobilis HER1398]